MFSGQATSQITDEAVLDIAKWQNNILLEFQKSHSEMINKGSIPDFNQIKDLLSNQYGISNIDSKVWNSSQEWFSNIAQLEFLKSYILDDSITEIIIHDHCNIQLDKNGILENLFIDILTPEELQLSLTTIAANAQINWNYAAPFQSFFSTIQNQLFRVTLIHHSLTAGQCSKIFLRKLSNSSISINNFTSDNQIQSLCKDMILQKKNILIAGNTGSGKTTLLKSLLQQIPDNEHLVILEDTHEIIPSNPSFTNLISENSPGKNLKDYCAHALRMRPDRIILGEIRSDEIVPFMLAMNTGHKGLMATLHANSASDALARAALLFCLYNSGQPLEYNLVLKLICQNIDYVLYLENREICQIAQVLGAEGDHSFIDLVVPNAQLSV